MPAVPAPTITTLEDSLRAAAVAALPGYTVTVVPATPTDLRDKCVAVVQVGYETKAVRIRYDAAADPDRVLTAVARSFALACQWEGRAYTLVGQESAA